jgi:polyisoprenoid-binding protein YceI
VTGADVTAQTASVFADVARLTEHLKTDDFFDAAANPEVRFLVTSLTPIAASDSASAGATHTATGSLTMRGTTNQITFPVEISFDGDVVTAEADFLINRHDWGIAYRGAPDDLVQDEVRVRLHIVAGRPPAL